MYKLCNTFSIRLGIVFETRQTENTIESDFFVMFISFLVRMLFFVEDLEVYNKCLQLLSVLYPKMKGSKLKQTVIELDIRFGHLFVQRLFSICMRFG